MIPNVVWLRIGLCFGLLGSLVVGQLPAARAQSDPAGFTTVINAPPTIIGRDDSIGSNTQLNVFDDEDVEVEVEVGAGFDAGSFIDLDIVEALNLDPSLITTNVELNLFSGGINFEFSARNGSVTNVFGGIIGPRPTANSGKGR